MQRRLLSAMRQGVAAQRPALTNLWQRLQRSGPEALAAPSHRLQLAMRGLHAVSPLATLDRGYAIVEDADSGQVLMRAADATVGADVRTRLAKGELIATVKSKKET
jgi:exodeoxyribonuclease VII large subunit